MTADNYDKKSRSAESAYDSMVVEEIDDHLTVVNITMRAKDMHFDYEFHIPRRLSDADAIKVSKLLNETFNVLGRLPIDNSYF